MYTEIERRENELRDLEQELMWLNSLLSDMGQRIARKNKQLMIKQARLRRLKKEGRAEDAA